jgi:glycosyltransferase involved in cell wall biosynthesis
MLYTLYQRALVYVFPSIEDFGIMPVEAQAAGAPVVTTSIGGAVETIEGSELGHAATADTVDSVAQAVAGALSRPRGDRAAAAAARRFSRERFLIQVVAFVTEGD